MANESDPEVIRQRMLENRTALTEKLEALEQQMLGVASSVTNTVESVKEGVQETVEAVKDSVSETVDNVKETVGDTVTSVKETFDLPLQVERRPWLMLAGSVGVGMLLGAFLRRRTVSNVGRLAGGVVRRFRGERREGPPPQAAVVEPQDGNGARKESEGVTDQLLGSVKDGLNRVKDLALGTLFATVEKVLVRELPEAVESHVKNFVEEAANKLKSNFTAPPPAEPTAEPTVAAGSKKKPERQETAFHPETGRPMRPGSW